MKRLRLITAFYLTRSADKLILRYYRDSGRIEEASDSLRLAEMLLAGEIEQGGSPGTEVEGG